MQHNHILKYFLTPTPVSGGLGVCCKILLFLLMSYAIWSFSEKVEFRPLTLRSGGCLQAKHLLPCRCIIPFNLICNMPLSWKSWILIFWPLGAGGGACEQNICYLGATFCDSNKLDRQHDHVLKKLNFDLLTQRSSGWAKYLLPCCYISSFLLIWYATWPCIGKSSILTVWLYGQVGRSSGDKIFATILLYFVIPFNLIFNMTMFWKKEFWLIDLIPRVGWGVGEFGGKKFATMLVHLWFP